MHMSRESAQTCTLTAAELGGEEEQERAYH